MAIVLRNFKKSLRSMKRLKYLLAGSALLTTVGLASMYVPEASEEMNSVPVKSGSVNSNTPSPAAGIVIREKHIITTADTTLRRYVADAHLFAQKWDTLAQPLFWRRIIDLSQDSAIVNVAGSRIVLDVVSTRNWKSQSEERKVFYKDSLKKAHGFPTETALNITIGKKEFYEYKKVIPEISKAIPYFDAVGTDPWYAQAILLIESPGKMQKSTVGAYGPFQLMKGVAKKYGLKINKYVDERKDFGKSATAAAKLLGSICVPYTKAMLESRGIAYKETDLWFRLMVLHSYHAGAGNVAHVLNAIAPTEGGMDLIRKMWVTEAGGFRTQSQNYSQVALASLMRFYDLMESEESYVHLSDGDRQLKSLEEGSLFVSDTLSFYESCLAGYEDDLVDETISWSQFEERLNGIQLRVNAFQSRSPMATNFTYPMNEKRSMHIVGQLISRKNFIAASNMAQLTVKSFPSSTQAHLQLALATQCCGNKKEAVAYYKKALDLDPNCVEASGAIKKITASR